MLGRFTARFEDIEDTSDVVALTGSQISGLIGTLHLTLIDAPGHEPTSQEADQPKDSKPQDPEVISGLEKHMEVGHQAPITRQRDEVPS